MFLGRENLRNPGSLEWVLEAIQYPLYGVDLYPTLAEKAAALAWVIIAEHVFHDGCKRTGMSALEALIESGDFQLNATDDEIINVALRVAGRQDVSDYAYEDLLRWVREKIGLRVA